MNFEEFDRVFDRFTASAFRLEARQRYAIDETDEDYLAWQAGRPRPERSVRTSPWLARVATSTVSQSKRWSRVHVVDHPLSQYVRYELVAYQENAAAGEQIRIADRAAHPDLATLDVDYWLFDDATDHPHAVIIDYDIEGNVTGFQPADDPPTLDQFRAWRDLALKHSADLNTYLAALGSPRQAA